MSVYVDNARHPFGRMIMCHMVADSEEELHRMVDAIGIKRKWFHRGHYNICLEKRAEAVQAGAIEIDQRRAAVLRRLLQRRASAARPNSPLMQALMHMGVVRP